MDLKKPFKLNNILLQLLGMWPIKGKFYSAYLVYAVCFHMFFTLMFMLPMWIEIFLVDDLATITRLSNMGLTELALFTKMVIMYQNMDKMQKLVKSVNFLEYMPQSELEEEMAKKRMRQLIKFMAVYYFTTTMGMFLGITGPLNAPVKVLPFYQWFFGFDWQKTDLRFKVLFTYQSVSLSFHACLNVMIDMFLPFFFNFAAIQCEFIGNRLSNLDENQPHYKEGLQKNVEHHQKIIEYCKLAVEVFSFPTFIQFCLSGFVICFNAYQISIVRSKTKIQESFSSKIFRNPSHFLE
jgi:hypothetical protein